MSKSEVVVTRFTPEEKEVVSMLAKSAGLTIAGYMRAVALGIVRPSMEVLTEGIEEWKVSANSTGYIRFQRVSDSGIVAAEDTPK